MKLTAGGNKELWRLSRSITLLMSVKVKWELEEKVKNVMFMDAVLVRWHSNTMNQNNWFSFYTQYVVPECDPLSAVK